MSTTTLAFDIIAKDRASDKFDDIGNSAHNSTSKLKKFAVVGAAAAAAGALMAGKALVGMAKSAIEDEKAQTLLAATLKNTTGATNKQIASVEDWITAQGKALGVADDDLRPALQRLAEATGDVGKAQKLASLAMDISAGTGKSLKTVSEALAKAQMGQVGGLSRYGIATRDAAGEMMTFDQVVKKASGTFSGQATTAAGTLEGKMGRLKLMFDEAKETLGAKLIPVLETGAEKLLVFVEQVEKGEGVGGKAVDVFAAIGKNLGTIIPVLGTVTTGVIAYTAATKIAAIATAVQTAGTVGATGATWSLNAALRANPIGIVITALTALAAGLVIAYKKSDTFRAIVDKAFAVAKAGVTLMWAAAKPIFEGMGRALEAVGEAGRWMWNNALQPVFRFFLTTIGTAMTKLGDLFVAMGKVPGMGWATTLGEKLQSAGDKAYTLGQNIRDIPERKDVEIHVTTVQHTTPGREGKGQNPGIGAHATGTNHARGGVALVGERGPELVDLPKGSVVHTASRTEAMTSIDYKRLAKEIVGAMRDGAPLVRLEDAGQVAHVRGAW